MIIKEDIITFLKRYKINLYNNYNIANDYYGNFTNEWIEENNEDDKEFGSSFSLFPQLYSSYDNIYCYERTDRFIQWLYKYIYNEKFSNFFNDVYKTYFFESDIHMLEIKKIYENTIIIHIDDEYYLIYEWKNIFYIILFSTSLEVDYGCEKIYVLDLDSIYNDMNIYDTIYNFIEKKVDYIKEINNFKINYYKLIYE